MVVGLNGSGNEARRGGRTAIGLWIVTIVLITCAPYLFLAARAEHMPGDEGRYDWILPPYPEDGLGYTAWVEQASRGAWLFKLKYTQISQPGVLFQPVFLVVGWVAAITGWSAGFALFVARIVAVVVFLLMLFRFARLFLGAGPELVVGLALVSLSSGFGLTSLPGGPSADLWMPEINTLWSLTWNPVFVVALALMLAVIGLVSEAGARGGDRLRAYLGAGGLTGLLAFIHAYDVPVVGLVVLLVTAIRLGPRMIGPCAAFTAFVLPALAILWFAATHNPVLAAHGEAGRMASPQILSYLAALGLPGVFAIYGAIRVIASGAVGRFAPLFVWTVSSFALAYAPVWFQRKMIMGVHIPICLIAAVGVCDAARRLSRGRKPVFAALLMGFVAVSTLAHARNVRSMLDEVRDDPTAYYLPSRLERALAFLGRETRPDDVVLAHYYVARHVPGRSGNTVTLGHWAQSVDLRAHMRWLGELFAPGPFPSAAQRQDALRESPIDYVLIDSHMREDWMRGTVPAWLETIGETVYEDGDIRIVEILRDNRLAPAGRPASDARRSSAGQRNWVRAARVRVVVGPLLRRPNRGWSHPGKPQVRPGVAGA